MKIEIHHPSGHVTIVPIVLSRAGNVMNRLTEDEKYLDEIIKNIEPHLIEGTKVYLTIESKANGKDI